MARLRSGSAFGLALIAVGGILFGLPATGDVAEATGDDPDAGTESEQEVDEIEVLGIRNGRFSEYDSASSTRIDLGAEEAELKRIEDVLGQAVGVQIRRYGGAGERAEVSIRGFSSSQVAVMLDGVKLNSSRGGGVDFSGIPLPLLEGVEVVRGAGALGAGSGAMGGVVQLRIRRPDIKGSFAQGETGSFGSYGWTLYTGRPGKTDQASESGAQRKGPGLDVGLGYNGFKTDGDYEFQRFGIQVDDDAVWLPPTPSATRINNRHEQHNGSLSLGRDFAEHGYLLLNEMVHYRSQGEPGLERSVPSAIAGQHRFAHQRVLRSVTQLRWEEVELPIDGSELAMALSYRFERSDFRDPDPALNASPVDDEFDDTTLSYSITPEWNGSEAGFSHRLRLTAGLDWDAVEASSQNAEDRLGLHLALGDELGILEDRVRIVPGLRLDWSDDTKLRLLPSIGLIVDPLPWLRLRAHAEESFRNPSLRDLYLPDRDQISGNPNLEAERALSADLGIAIRYESLPWIRDFEVETSFFHSSIDNSIIWIPVSPYKIRPENSDAATSKGVEVSASIGVGPWFSLSANHTELRATTDDEGVRLPGRSDRETFVAAKLGSPQIWKIVGEFHRIGSISVSRSGNYVLPGGDLWNARVALDLCRLGPRIARTLPVKKLWLSLALDNITDISVRGSLGFPRPGRTMSIGVEAQW
jgi:outer membrane receptor protein involved in Fe transport